MEQRKQFITEYLCGTDSFKALCQKFGISEKLDISGKTAFWNLASPASRIRARPLLILRISWMKIPSFV